METKNFIKKIDEIKKKNKLDISAFGDLSIGLMNLLATSMRLYEVGNRLLHEKKKKEAVEMYKDAAEIYSLFWSLNSNSKKKIKIKENSKEAKGIFSSIKKLLE